MLFVNDCSHNVCAKRAGHLSPSVLSCQRIGMENIHPVTRGIPVAVPSMNYLCKSIIFNIFSLT
jgi:hypothetical protein